MAKQLTRLPNDKIIFGICSGLAQYFEIDKTIVRIIMVLLLVFTGFFPVGLIYIIAYFIMPVDSYSGTSNPDIIK
ncbi:PspC domain-containing protein [Candidatus Ruminimicrobiellum ovillum]|uniref:PspC domain-containing protein n=1 Tax=Candidatus Ruminimicrobiellum ovillum TaxID=1947927 RepID=UPI00355A00DB